MKKFEYGCIAVILGGILLSAQLYFLKIIQLAEAAVKSEWRTNAIDYAGETPLRLSFIVTAAIIAFGAILIIWAFNEKRSKRSNIKC